VRFGLWLAWVVVFAALAAYGAMTQRIERAAALYWDGSTDDAVEAFQALDARFRRHPWMARLLPAERDRVLDNYLRLLYLDQEYDRVIVEGEAALLEHPGPAPVVSYWLGNAYYRKALGGQAEEEDALAWLRRAGDQYEQAIVQSSDDWDLKYNHEMVQTLLRKLDSQTEPSSFDILRPDDKPSPQPPARRIG